MTIDPTYLQELFVKHLKHTLSDEERLLLQEWRAASTENQLFSDQLSDTKILTASYVFMLIIISKKRWQRMLATTISSGIVNTETPAVHRVHLVKNCMAQICRGNFIDVRYWSLPLEHASKTSL